MQLSKKQKKLSRFLSQFLKSASNFEPSERKDDLHSLRISKITDWERYGRINA